MKNAIFIIIVCILFQRCKKNEKRPTSINPEKNLTFQKYEVDSNILPDSISQKISALKKNNSVVCIQSSTQVLKTNKIYNSNFVCNAYISQNDTLNIWINNFNGYFGNGVLVKVHDKKFAVKSVDPNVVKGIKFQNYTLVEEKLILNQPKYKKGDYLAGYLYFEGKDSIKNKKMDGYFRTKIALE